MKKKQYIVPVTKVCCVLPQEYCNIVIGSKDMDDDNEQLSRKDVFKDDEWD